MIARWQRLLNLLELTRVALVFTAVSNSWLIIFLDYGLEPRGHRNAGLDDYPLWAFLLLGGGVAAGLHTYGIAVNDMLDVRHDRLFSPQRPLAAGSVSWTTVVLVCLVSLLMALTAAVFMGRASMLMCLCAAGAILFYNIVGKFLPASGILVLGLVRALNMLMPNPFLSFAWPIWLTVVHVVVCWAVAYHFEGRRPHMRSSGPWILCAALVFATLAMMQWMAWRQARGGLQPPPGIWVGPLVAVAVFAVLAWWKLSGPQRPVSTRRAAGASFMRLALLWLIVYDASWLFGARLYRQAAIHVALLILAYTSMRVLGTLRQLALPEPTFRLERPS